MATYGKYQVYYEKIKTEVEKIREENGYLNLSKAFAHWYLKNTLKMMNKILQRQLLMETEITELMQLQFKMQK